MIITFDMADDAEKQCEIEHFCNVGQNALSQRFDKLAHSSLGQG